ncbi:MAG: AAA family ATPase [Bacteroidota bacterium]|nr:AAA family ATPase [Bacteroidota bacterium]
MDSFKPEHIKITEDSYCSPDTETKFKKNFLIISGCSGSGKSTLLQEIANRGFKIIHEPGRQVVKEQHYIDGDALPWKDWQKFIELTISRTMYQYNCMIDEDEIVFFDRAIIDQINWEDRIIEVPKHLMNAALKYRFNEMVFMTPPWQEIYKNDNERKKTYDDALAGYHSTVKMYERFGHKIILIPKINVSERADFVIEMSKKSFVFKI